jgi:hypothetical protein
LDETQHSIGVIEHQVSSIKWKSVSVIKKSLVSYADQRAADHPPFKPLTCMEIFEGFANVVLGHLRPNGGTHTKSPCNAGAFFV